MHPNEKLLRDTDEAQRQGDVEGFMNGYTDAYADDHELLNVAVTVYEALYQWCRHHP